MPQSGLFFPHARAGRRPSTRQGEAQPAQAHRAEQAGGWGLILEDFLYDVVGNPVEIRDWRDPEEWPIGAKPVTKKIEYDDLYRATRVKYEYAAGDDDWTSPFDAENDGEVGGPPNDAGPRRAKPSPHISFEQRILDQKFEYDWVGNSEKTSDDADGFYDRSLGDITNDSQHDKPYQLRSAQLASTQLDRGGHLEARYDAAGHLTALAVERAGNCLGGASSDACNQQFVYDWDEVGRLARARRWDGNTDSVDTFHPGSAGTPEADLRHVYDASDQRVLKEAVDEAGEHSYTLYVFASLEIRRAQYGTTFSDSGVSGDSDYEVSHWTVAPYLMANGVRLARLVYHGSSVVPEDNTGSSGGPGVVNASSSQLHVFFELGDHLGSTSVVLDKATGELVERATFQAYGGAESDYRPGRWENFREDYRFTGKEEDVEVGLQYFGKRYLNPLLGRWVSADPLAIHAPGEADLNVYAYVSGSVLKNVDPLGLQQTSADAPASEAGNTPNSSQSSNVVTLPEIQIHGSVPSGSGKDEAASKGPVPLKDDADYVLAGAWNRGVDATADALESAGTSGAGVRVDEEGETLVLLMDPTAAKAAEKIRDSKIDTSTGTPEQRELTRKSGIIAGFFAKVLGLFGLGKGGRVEETVTLRRGVTQGHPGYKDATNGVARPRGGTATPSQHNRGNTQSEYTSWTTDREVSAGFATNNGAGVELKANVPKSRIVKSPDMYEESEVLVRGTIKDAMVKEIK